MTSFKSMLYTYHLALNHLHTKIFEPRHDKMCLREFLTMPDTNWPVQPQKLARVLKFWLKSRDIILRKQRTTKALIRLCGCAGWSASLLFAYGIRHIFSWPGSFSYQYLANHLSKMCCKNFEINWQIKGFWANMTLNREFCMGNW